MGGIQFISGNSVDRFNLTPTVVNNVTGKSRQSCYLRAAVKPIDRSCFDDDDDDDMFSIGRETGPANKSFDGMAFGCLAVLNI